MYVQVPPDPKCPESEYIEPNSGLFDYGNTYDFSYSGECALAFVVLVSRWPKSLTWGDNVCAPLSVKALIGAMINGKKFERSAYGPWEQVTGVVFYPPVADNRGLPSKVNFSRESLGGFSRRCWRN